MADPKFDPMKELSNLRDNVSKALEKGSQRAGKMIEQGIQTVKDATGGASGIKLDVYQLDEQVVIRTSPIDGLIPDSIEVSMENNILTVTGETREDDVPEGANFLVRERKFGIFQRSVTINIPVKAHQAKAKLNKNSLNITLPIDMANFTSINIHDDEADDE